MPPLTTSQRCPSCDGGQSGKETRRSKVRRGLDRNGPVFIGQAMPKRAVGQDEADVGRRPACKAASARTTDGVRMCAASATLAAGKGNIVGQRRRGRCRHHGDCMLGLMYDPGQTSRVFSRRTCLSHPGRQHQEQHDTGNQCGRTEHPLYGSDPLTRCFRPGEHGTMPHSSRSMATIADPKNRDIDANQMRP